MDQSSSSRVTVQYHDPAGVFPLISKQLSSRLPLRNLNWQSPSRPLRRIKSLQVELVPEAAASAIGEISRENESITEAAESRRHQIPGLKTSPYLRLYLLRCDDKEQYKESSKAAIRAWIKETAGSKQRNDHDAFEWLVLHVVLPNTAAASEPRWRDNPAKEADELRERPKSSSKWPTKGSRTVFDRLRTDFNDSKAGPDRVAQIRLTKDDVSADLLPVASGGLSAWEESAVERENAWHDLVTKMKALILGPFDARVRQYEADIAVQESRRSLPGWNFCTFFVHKEGLARALESIGLVEDALAVYDELGLGLETVVHDIASGAADKTATSFATVTPGLRVRLLDGPSVHLTDAEYRRKIVNSDISVFDFFCYIFGRQRTLLARLANVEPADGKFHAAQKAGGDDLVLLGEICWRTSNFIHNTSRMLRQDLQRQGEPSSEGLVNSWTYMVADEILNQAVVPVFEKLILDNDDDRSATNGASDRQLPQRASSLAIRPRRPDMNGQLENVLPGQAELATYRAELLMLQRRAIESVARLRGWSVRANQNGIPTTRDASMSPSIAGILSDETQFHHEFARLSVQAKRHYTLATQWRLENSVRADLAMLYYQQAEYGKAAESLRQVITAGPRSLEHPDLFPSYIRCLEELGRGRDHAQAVLDFAAKEIRDKSEDGNASRLMCELINRHGIEADVKRSMHEFCDQIKVHPRITHYHDRSGLSIQLSFCGLLKEALTVDRISVSLKAVEDPKDELILTSTGDTLSIEPGPNEVSLGADVVCAGAYYIDQVRIDAGRLRLFHDLVPAPEIPTLVVGDAEVHAGATAEQHLRPWVLLYPREHDFDMEFDVGQDIDVSRTRTLELRLLGGDCDIQQIELKLRPQAAGLRLHLADAQVDRIDANNISQLSLGELRAGQTATVQIPYTLEDTSPGRHVAFRCEATCVTNGGSFTFAAAAKQLADLPLIIDVQDLFQVESLISNFSVRTIDGIPVVIESAELSDSAAYHVEAPGSSPLPALIVNQQYPVDLLYRITHKASEEPLGPTESRVLLRATYRRVQDAVTQSISKQFLLSLAKSDHHHLKRLLLPHLQGALRRSYRDLELTRAALMKQCEVPSFEQAEWNDVIREREVLEWLEGWHTAHRHVAFCIDEAKERRMVIAVDVPRPDFVHSVSIRREAHSAALELGEQIEATLEVDSTTGWSFKEQAERDFLVDVHADPDVWLVGGLKRAGFSCGRGRSSRTFKIGLVPLRAGLHSLPSVDIRPAAEVDGEPFTSMTHCRTGGETVHVVQGSQQTRVHVPGSAMADVPLIKR